MSSTHLFHLKYFKVNKKMLWEQKMSYVRKEKNLKSVKGLQRNFKKRILKNSNFFANISKLRPKQKKNAKGKS